MKKLTFERDNGNPLTLEAERVAGERDVLRVRLSPDDAERTISARRLRNGDVEITDGPRIFRVPVAAGNNNQRLFQWDGQAFTFAPVAATAARKAGGESGSGGGKRSGILTAPMGGVVAEVTVAEGDTVAAYQAVAVVEAMKVLATLEAPFDGVVRAVHVQKGDRVEQGAALVEIAPQDSDTNAGGEEEAATK